MNLELPIHNTREIKKIKGQYYYKPTLLKTKQAVMLAISGIELVAYGRTISNELYDALALNTYLFLIRQDTNEIYQLQLKQIEFDNLLLEQGKPLDINCTSVGIHYNGVRIGKECIVTLGKIEKILTTSDHKNTEGNDSEMQKFSDEYSNPKYKLKGIYGSSKAVSTDLDRNFYI